MDFNAKWGGIVFAGVVAAAVSQASWIRHEFAGAKEDFTAQQKQTITEKGLTDCGRIARFVDINPAVEGLNQTWIGRQVLQNMRKENLVVCSLPQPQPKTQRQLRLVTKAMFFLNGRIIALGASGDAVSFLHEGIHAFQESPAAAEKQEAVTAAYQTLLAREVGAYSLAVLHAYQRMLNGDDQDWQRVQRGNLTEIIASQVLQLTIRDNPQIDAQLRDATQKPPARLVDEFIFQNLASGMPVVYGAIFYAQEIKRLTSDSSVDFGPLSPKEIITAAVGGLYTNEDLPKTTDYLTQIGRLASSLEWYHENIKPPESRAKSAAQRPDHGLFPACRIAVASPFLCGRFSGKPRAWLPS